MKLQQSVSEQTLTCLKRKGARGKLAKRVLGARLAGLKRAGKISDDHFNKAMGIERKS